MTQDEIQLLIHLLLTLWLLPCALQDYRTRRVSNWLTVPLFFAAWPAAIILSTWPLTCAVFLGTYTAWKCGAGMGGADGKVAVGLAALSPPALLLSLTLQALAFLYLRYHKRAARSIPGVLWSCVAMLVVAAAQCFQSFFVITL